MAIEFVGATITSRAGINVGTYPIALNSGLTGGSRSSVQEGDLVIGVHSVTAPAGRTITVRDPASADYNAIYAASVGSSVFTSLRVAYKFMGSTPDDSTVFGNSGNSAYPLAYAVYVFSGVDQTTPLDVTATLASSTGSAIPNPAAITPTTDGAYIFVVAAAGHTQGTFGFTNSDLTDFINIGQNDTYDVTLGMGHKPDWVSGAFDPAAWTFGAADATTFSYSAVTVALRPASTGGKIKVWNGSAWVAKPIKVWNGSAWAEKPLKRWNGSAWVKTNY